MAEKTFNPRLGIVGGISILGTSGIVEPMSERALVATIEAEMRQKAADREYLLVTPGNYGTDYLKGNFPFAPEEAVKCSNYVGQTIDLAVNLGLKGILFVAHIGKFVKVAGGIMNTHSREADARMEILAACALQAQADAGQVREILSCVTTDEGLRGDPAGGSMGEDHADPAWADPYLPETESRGAAENRSHCVLPCIWGTGQDRGSGGAFCLC